MTRYGVYLRVSTEEQSLHRQQTKTTEYVQERLGGELGEIEYYRDKSTGTNTDRSGFRRMMSDAENNEIDAVVVSSLSRISRSVRDLRRVVDRLKPHGVSVHLISEGMVVDPTSDDPFQKAMFTLLGMFAELEADLAQQRVREGIAAKMESEDYHHGPAPLGFEKDSGELLESTNYDDVVAVLEMVQKGNLSKRKAAKRLDTSRATINRSLDRPELYGL